MTEHPLCPHCGCPFYEMSRGTLFHSVSAPGCPLFSMNGVFIDDFDKIIVWIAAGMSTLGIELHPNYLSWAEENGAKYEDGDT